MLRKGFVVTLITRYMKKTYPSGLTLAFTEGQDSSVNLCHAYMALGGAHGILCFGCEKDRQQTDVKLSYSKTLLVWKRLVVERFEELNLMLM